MLILARNILWQAWLKSVWLKKLLYLNCSHAFQLSYLNHSYSSPCPFFCMWLVILNKGKVTHAMILKKEIIINWVVKWYIPLACLHLWRHYTNKAPWHSRESGCMKFWVKKNFQWDLHSIMSCRLYFEGGNISLSFTMTKG